MPMSLHPLLQAQQPHHTPTPASLQRRKQTRTRTPPHTHTFLICRSGALPPETAETSASAPASQDEGAEAAGRFHKVDNAAAQEFASFLRENNTSLPVAAHPGYRAIHAKVVAEFAKACASSGVATLS